MKNKHPYCWLQPHLLGCQGVPGLQISPFLLDSYHTRSCGPAFGGAHLALNSADLSAYGKGLYVQNCGKGRVWYVPVMKGTDEFQQSPRTFEVKAKAGVSAGAPFAPSRTCVEGASGPPGGPHLEGPWAPHLEPPEASRPLPLVSSEQAAPEREKGRGNFINKRRGCL